MKRIFWVVVAGILVALVGSSAVASAAERVANVGDVALIVRYKDIELAAARPQADIEFTVVSLAADRLRLGMRVAGAPEDWAVSIRQKADDYQIAEVALEGQAQTSLLLRLRTPAEVTPGTERLQLQATSASGQVVARQTISVAVASEEAPVVSEGVRLTAVYPAVAGPPSETFAFEMILSNRTGARNTFSLATEGPEGWEVVIVPVIERDKIISGVSVVDDGLHVLQAQVTAPSGAKPGSYPVKVITWFEDARDELDLEVVLTGTAQLGGTTGGGRLNLEATAGRELSEIYRVSNTGEEEILGVNLLSNPPDGWEVEMEPKVIDHLAPGASEDVAVAITPPANAVPGEYFVVLAALNPDTNHSMLLRVDVRHSTLWRWFGLGVLIFVVSSLMGLYARLNRR